MENWTTAFFRTLNLNLSAEEKQAKQDAEPLVFKDIIALEQKDDERLKAFAANLIENNLLSQHWQAHSKAKEGELVRFTEQGAAEQSYVVLGDEKLFVYHHRNAPVAALEIALKMITEIKLHSHEFQGATASTSAPTPTNTILGSCSQTSSQFQSLFFIPLEEALAMTSDSAPLLGSHLDPSQSTSASSALGHFENSLQPPFFPNPPAESNQNSRSASLVLNSSENPRSTSPVLNSSENPRPASPVLNSSENPRSSSPLLNSSENPRSLSPLLGLADTSTKSQCLSPMTSPKSKKKKGGISRALSGAALEGARFTICTLLGSFTFQARHSGSVIDWVDAICKASHKEPPAALRELQDLPGEVVARPVIYYQTHAAKAHTHKVSSKKSSIVIGRSAQADLSLDDQKISRSHAKIWFNSRGVALISDLGSNVGTKLNSKEITCAVLSTGDLITIGATVLSWNSPLLKKQ